jgi:hypothetical protein
MSLNFAIKRATLEVHAPLSKTRSRRPFWTSPMTKHKWEGATISQGFANAHPFMNLWCHLQRRPKRPGHEHATILDRLRTLCNSDLRRGPSDSVSTLYVHCGFQSAARLENDFCVMTARSAKCRSKRKMILFRIVSLSGLARATLYSSQHELGLRSRQSHWEFEQ